MHTLRPLCVLCILYVVYTHLCLHFSLVNGSGNVTNVWNHKTIDSILIVPNVSARSIFCRVTMFVTFLWNWTKWIMIGMYIHTMYSGASIDNIC